MRPARTGIDEVENKVRELQPNLLVRLFLGLLSVFPGLLTCSHYQFCASMWTPEESARIQRIARSIVPDIKTHAVPEGLQVEKGPDAIVEYLKAHLPEILE